MHDLSIISNTGTRKSKRPWHLSAFLALVMISQLLAGVAAAAETVDSIAFETVPAPLSLYVGDDAYQLKVWANISGGTTTTRDVTGDATWTSSNSSVVKVTKGLLTPAGEGSATVTVKYQTAAAISLQVKVLYQYDKVEIRSGGSVLTNEQHVKLGETLSLNLSAYQGSTSTDVTADAAWSSSSSSVATVDADGDVTLLAAGTAVITGSYKGRSSSVTLKVTSPYSSISVSPGQLVELKVGDDDKLITATAVRTTGGSENVTADAAWHSGNTAVATTDKGAVRPVGAGTTTITVSHLGVSKTITVVVRPSHQAMKLSRDSALHMIVTDAPEALTAFVLDDADKAPEDVTSRAEWTSSNVYTATVSGGVVTPKAAGTTKITVTYKGLSRSLNVTVYPSLTEIKTGEDAINGFIEGSGSLPKVQGVTIAEETIDVSSLVTWTSSKPGVVEAENGKWVAKSTGDAILTASAGGKSIEVNIVIHEKPLALLSESNQMSIVLGKETELPALRMMYENGVEEEDLADKVTWKSSSPNLLIRNGKIKGLLASNATLTASYLGKSVSIKVTIEQEITKLAAQPVSVTLNPGKSKSVKVIGYYKDGSKVSLASKINWSSGNENIFTVKGSTIKAIAAGSSKLTGTYQGKTVTVNVTVVPKLKKLTASSASIKLAPGAVSSVSVTALLDTGTIVSLNVTETAAWSSSNTKVATVTDGKITAVGKGSARIKAVYEGKSVSVRVSVK
ncbi:Ig-like domain-containing protein [Paenibacillus tarimensis]|uniref:Ig-like domain-containing protein n=1 Tax=Paenibacillus tarimensis TaxID=416012 RepID=UPI001F3586AD|nr:Ig-like domain-containing protein [Paenibacillus tarimensis]MCF2944152.1 Ig-like domain-containing protein [Paenibacillus tarimensis]